MKKTEIFAAISGAVFLISGAAKAIDVSAFQGVIVSYGFANLSFTAPLIVMAEIVLGLMLVFQMWQKWTAFAAGVMVVGFTAVYIYGLTKGIEDCGCFGRITFLNTSPTFTFIRNAVLAGLLAVVWYRSENKAVFNNLNTAVSLAFVSMAAFMAGYTFDASGMKQAKEPAVAIANSPLRDFVTTSRDSTYLVFAFSYTCPHCLNSIANLKEYQQSGAVDRVIGLAVGDSISERRFMEVFRPNFIITNRSSGDLLRLTNRFPTSYFIRNDSIVAQFSGEVPCAYLFEQAVF